MSTSAQHVVSAPTPVERRFYRRIAPSSLTHVTFGRASNTYQSYSASSPHQGRALSAHESYSASSAPANSAMLLNLGENGLLVSTPLGLTRNFVYRVFIPLNGLPGAINVLVRVVWTNDSRRAGLQMLDLSEHDREQIRKWAQSESGPDIASEPRALPIKKPSQKLPAMPVPSAAESPKRAAPAASVVPPRLLPRRTRRVSAKLALATSAAWLVAGLATAMFFGDRPLRKSFVDEGPRLKTIFHPVGAAKNVSRSGRPSSAQTIANTPDAPPEADQIPLPILPAEAPSANALGSPDASENAAAQPGSPSVSKIATDKLSEPEIPRAKIDWSSASAQPAHLPGSEDISQNIPENINDAAHTTDHTNAPLEMDPIPVAPPAFPPPPMPARPHVARAPEPAVLSMDAPNSRVLDLNPVKARTGIFTVPGERVFESAFVTTRVQRSIHMPAGYAPLAGSDSRKVVVGELLSRVDPHPPHFPVRLGSSVTVRAVIDKNGRVETLRPVSGPMTLLPNVARAVREWRYQPTWLDGKLVETEAYLVFEFHSPPNPQM